LKEIVLTKHTDEIDRQVMLNYLDDNIKYLSFEYTMTCCKKCAFNYDLNDMELCPICKKNYKGIQYKSCLQCLPEDKRKAALKKIAFGKEWQAMHEELDID
jgi:PHP family Zn ribbon phosphoesterase